MHEPLPPEVARRVVIVSQSRCGGKREQRGILKARAIFYPLMCLLNEMTSNVLRW